VRNGEEETGILCVSAVERRANPSQTIGDVGRSGLAIGQGKQVTAIKNGHSVARSTLRKALMALRRTSGAMFDVDAYIIDQRTIKSA